MSEHKHIRTIDPTATTACLGALVFWSLGPIFIKYLTGYLDSWTQNFLRYAVACCFWLPYLIYCARTKRLDHQTWKRAIIPAGANIIMQSLWAISFYLSGPAFMVLLTKTNIVWITLFSLILFPEERPLLKSRRFWLGLVLAATGVSGVLYFKADLFGAGSTDLAHKTAVKAVLVGLATAFMWGVYAVSVRAAFRNIDSRTGFSVISIYTCFGLGVLSLLFGDVQRSVHIGPWQWFCIVISGVTAIAVAHTLYYSAMRRLGATIPALVILAQPFAVLAISHAVFGESLNAYQVLFGLVLLFGAGLAIWAQQHLGRTSRRYRGRQDRRGR